jgi:hypothetical protein
MLTRHARVRAQQRGIPPLIDALLDAYGHEQYDGHGGVIRYFDKKSRRQMERDFGREPVRRLLPGWSKAYKVDSASDGKTITTGIRLTRIRRT